MSDDTITIKKEDCFSPEPSEGSEDLLKEIAEQNAHIKEIIQEAVASAIARDRDEIMAVVKVKIFEYEELRKGSEEKKLNMTQARFKGCRDALIEFLAALETKPV